MCSGVGDRRCSERMPLSQETNFLSRVWSKREGLVEDKSEYTPKIYDSHRTLTSYVVMLSFLLTASCVCHPHKHNGAVIMSTISVVAGQCWICAQLRRSEMEHPQARQTTSALGWIICLCPVPTLGKCLLAHCRGHLLCRVPLGTATTHPSPAGMDSWIDAASIKEGLAWLLVSPLAGRASGAILGEETISVLVKHCVSSPSPSSHSWLPGTRPSDASVPMSKVVRVAISHVQPQIEPGKQLACSELVCLQTYVFWWEMLLPLKYGS